MASCTHICHSHDVVSCAKENEVAATCAKEGSYDEVIYCTECEASHFFSCVSAAAAEDYLTVDEIILH